MLWIEPNEPHFCLASVMCNSCPKYIMLYMFLGQKNVRKVMVLFILLNGQAFIWWWCIFTRNPSRWCTWCTPPFLFLVVMLGHRSFAMTVVAGSVVSLFISLLAIDCISCIIPCHDICIYLSQGIPTWGISSRVGNSSSCLVQSLHMPWSCIIITIT